MKEIKFSKDDLKIIYDALHTHKLTSKDVVYKKEIDLIRWNIMNFVFESTG